MAEISQKIINFVRNKKYRSRAIVFYCISGFHNKTELK